jgi:hypothetical protein
MKAIEQGAIGTAQSCFAPVRCVRRVVVGDMVCHNKLNLIIAINMLIQYVNF